MANTLLIAAPLHKRFAASMLDGFLLIALTFPIAAFAGSKDLAIALSFALNISYFTYCHSSVAQATVGKQMLRIMVVDSRGARLSRRRALERTLAYLLPFSVQFSSLEPKLMASLMIWLVLAWFMPMFFTRHKNGVHDILCGTRVVEGVIKDK